MIAELYYRYSKLDKQKQFALLADNEQEYNQCRPEQMN